jgi:hypothetical protein
MQNALSGVGRKISDGGEDRDEALQAFWRSEALYHPLAFSQRHVRIFGPIVQTLMRPMLDMRHDLTPCCSIRA